MGANTRDSALDMDNYIEQDSNCNHVSSRNQISKAKPSLNCHQLDDVYYVCKRCTSLTFAKPGQLAVHYHTHHPSNDRELHSQINKPCHRGQQKKTCSSTSSNTNQGTDDTALPGANVAAICEQRPPRILVSKENSSISSMERSPARFPSDSVSMSTCSTPQMTNETEKRKLKLPVQQAPFIDEREERDEVGRKRRKVNGVSKLSTIGNIATDENVLSDSDRNINSPSPSLRTAQTEVVSPDNTYHVKGDQTSVNGDLYKFDGPVTIQAGEHLQQSLMKSNGNGGTTVISTSKEPTGNTEGVKNTSEYTSVSPEVVANAGIPPVKYNSLRFDVGDMLTPRQFRKMKMLLQQDTTSNLGIPRAAIEEINDTWALLDCMEKFNYLSSSNTWFLQYLMYNVGSRKLYKLVFDYKTERLVSSRALFVYEPHEIQGAGKSKVELKVTGDIKQFRPINAEQFRELLSTQLGDIEYVSEIGVQHGSVILYFQVPSSSKENLRNQPQLNEWCKENNIILVCFDEEVIVKLPASEATRATKYAESGNTIVDVLKNDENRIRQQPSFQTDLKIGRKSILHLATELNYHNMVKFLISQGANLNEVDQMKATPIHMAVFLNHFHICRTFLKDPNVDINAVDKLGNTALHIATCQGDHNMCRLLIEHGAATDIKNQDGKSSVDLARQFDFSFLLLLTGDAKVEDLTVAVDEHTLCCPICCCSFKKPQILPCGHNFCSNCLETQWRTSKQKDYIECSICKQKATVPDDDITRFMLNIPLFQQVEEARHIQKWGKQKYKESPSFITDPEDETSGDSSEDSSSMERMDGIRNDISKDSSSMDQMDGSRKDTSEDSSSMDQMDSSRKDTSEESTTMDRIEKSRKDISEEATEPKNEETSGGRVLVTRNSLTCRLCQEMFKKPVRKLHCSHSFCEGCLKVMVMTSKFHLKCPTCEEETDIPKKDIVDLIHDRNVDSQVEDAHTYDESASTILDTVIDEEREDWDLDDITDSMLDKERKDWDLDAVIDSMLDKEREDLDLQSTESLMKKKSTCINRIEKRRRERINKSLAELQSLLFDAIYKSNHPQSKSKLEKADILEMTACYLKTIQMQQKPDLDVRISDSDIIDVARNIHLTRDHLHYLFLQLSITSVDIDNSEPRADTRDFKLQAFSVLQFWRITNGERATRKAVIEALDACSFIEAKEILMEKWTDNTPASVSSDEAKLAKYQSNFTECVNEVSRYIASTHVSRGLQTKLFDHWANVSTSSSQQQQQQTFPTRTSSHRDHQQQTPNPQYETPIQQQVVEPDDAKTSRYLTSVNILAPPIESHLTSKPALEKSKKSSKPLMEAKRRERINDSLLQLKHLVQDATHESNPHPPMLSKADIIDETVHYMKTIQRQQISESPDSPEKSSRIHRKAQSHGEGSQSQSAESNNQITNQDITDVINLLGRDDLRKLFYALDIPSRNIEKAEMTAGTLDVDLRAKRVFETWCQRNGQQATRERVLCGLEECGNKNAQEQLEEKWKMKASANSDLAKPGQYQSTVTECMNEVTPHYLGTTAGAPKFHTSTVPVNQRIKPNYVPDINLTNPNPVLDSHVAIPNHVPVSHLAKPYPVPVGHLADPYDGTCSSQQQQQQQQMQQVSPTNTPSPQHHDQDVWRPW